MLIHFPVSVNWYLGYERHQVHEHRRNRNAVRFLDAAVEAAEDSEEENDED